MSIGRGGCGLVRKPEIPGGVEVGIVERRGLGSQKRSPDQPKQNQCKDRVGKGDR
ncbi:MAG: hypothetical protein P8O23_03220 [Opitutales bacterium]|nr:hypothetical protein [Opitutales bacterium]